MPPATVSATPSLPIVAALDRLWHAIRARHPDVPEVVIAVAGADWTKNGHFSQGRWRRGDATVHELFINASRLADGSHAVLETVLHEAAHGLSAPRGIQDLSRQGRYHNQRYRALAAEIGLEIACHPVYGWTITSVPPATLAVYRREIRLLERALTVSRDPEPLRKVQTRRRSSNNGITVMCNCGRRIRIATSVYLKGSVICGVCMSVFWSPDLPSPDDPDWLLTAWIDNRPEWLYPAPSAST